MRNLEYKANTRSYKETFNLESLFKRKLAQTVLLFSSLKCTLGIFFWLWQQVWCSGENVTNMETCNSV